MICKPGIGFWIQYNNNTPYVADEIEGSVKKFKTVLSDDAVKRVVDKLTGFYDIDKLKFLTQVRDILTKSELYDFV